MAVRQPNDLGPTVQQLTPIVRECVDCGRRFEISADEQEFFNRLADSRPTGKSGTGWRLPRTCTHCRFARRRDRESLVDDGVDEQLTCIECQNVFVFEAGEKRYFAARNYSRPRRCASCRAATKRERTQ